jgi:glucose/arabinose dehydrogenase
MRQVPAIAVLSGLLLIGCCHSARAAIAGLERVATGLNLPLFATHAPGDNDRLFVLEKDGDIKIVDLNSKTVTGTFLTVSDTDFNSSDEGGLLGLAFHPEYSNVGSPGHGKFYVYVTVDNGGDTSLGVTSPFSSHIREYSVTANPNVADPGSQREILSWVQPQTNHNAGWIGFSPNDGFLYISSGDGGGSNDNAGGHTAGTGNAQDTTSNLLGKMLRIDVGGDDFPGDANRNYTIPSDNPFVGVTGDDEIWAYGLRNPFRNSFDRDTGDLWIADVGQAQREEIDFQAAGRDGGENYGWRLREGNIQTPTVGGPEPTGYVGPVYDYTHGSGTLQGNAVIGGYVYRGPDPTLQGTYFFADEVSNNVWRFAPANPTGTVQNIDDMLTPDVGVLNAPTSFAEDAVGNLYIVDYTTGGFPPTQNVGEIYRIVTDALLAGDYDADGDVDEDDYAVWKTSFGSTANLAADGNGNNVVDAADYTVWRDHLGDSVHAAGNGTGAGSASAVPEPSTVIIVGQLLCILAAGTWYNRT